MGLCDVMRGSRAWHSGLEVFKLDLFRNGSVDFPLDPICIIFFFNGDPFRMDPRTVRPKGEWKTDPCWFGSERPVQIREKEREKETSYWALPAPSTNKPY